MRFSEPDNFWFDFADVGLRGDQISADARLGVNPIQDAGAADDVSPFDLIWDVDDGTTPYDNVGHLITGEFVDFIL